MTSKNKNIQTMQVKDCEILNIATAVRAQNLKELRDELKTIHPESIYYHFWASKLRPAFEKPEYNNDFATWAYKNLHNNMLAERLSLINPGMFSNIEDLRSKLVEVIESTLQQDPSVENSKESEQFQFTRADMILFNSEFSVSKPEELTTLIPTLPLGSIYFHFIESKNGPEDINTFVSSAGVDYSELSVQLSILDPYYFTLTELRSRASKIFKDFFQGAKI
ncbi:MAG: hypothetical protein DHS20C13_18310 [Thermodesulfobacteriota bacterium]|nr:MAG: hypothetical protein DHS20C13_18310 [Thermodesulfobacteriota bacterium]